MKSLTVLSFFISLVVLVMSSSIYFYYISPISEFTYSTTAFVTQDTAGFDVNTSAITFGSIIIGGTSTRSILVNNSYPFPIRVKPEIEGDIAQLVTYDPTIINPYNTSKFYLTIYADSYDLVGNYTGNITLKLMRA